MESPDPFLLADPSGRDETYPPTDQVSNTFIHELDDMHRNVVHDSRDLSTVRPPVVVGRSSSRSLRTIGP